VPGWYAAGAPVLWSADRPAAGDVRHAA
jgi:hypothetical protein